MVPNGLSPPTPKNRLSGIFYMTKKTSLSDDVVPCLERAIAKALESYHCFMEQDAPEDAKGFSAHHNAAKVAIAHVELLLKIAKAAKKKAPQGQLETDLKKLISKAEAEVRNYRKIEKNAQS